MNYEEALNILGLKSDAEKEEIRTNYRRLIRRVHPDAQTGGAVSQYRYSAHEINAAYEYLIKNRQAPETKKPDTEAGGHKRWNAPLNETAYAQREIYHYAESSDGSPIGTFSVASGKYYLTDDEDYKLFLLSIYNCSRKLLEDLPDHVIEACLPELAYLVSAQFVNPEEILAPLLIEDGIYYVPAMMEPVNKSFRAKEGDMLLPGSIRKHRLFLNDQTGREVGYVSFSDDRLYHALVPMFEQRMVQLKIRVSGKSLKTFGPSCNIDLWIKMAENGMNQMTVSINSRIEALLKEAKGY